MAERSQPYVTIRSRRAGDGGSMSSADSTYGSGPGNSTPTATHDISRVSYHVKHIDSFAKSLEESATRVFPNQGQASQRYQKVHALLLHWSNDDLFVLPELEDLDRCLREDYGFDTDVFAIPAENSHLELMMRIGALIKEHESPDTLLVVYYGGHARIDESRQSTWCATRHSNSPWLQWSAIQTLLERSPSDVLILLDCCAGAASATFANGKSTTETISASSWDAIAPDPGRYSFTNALIDVLQEWRLRVFSAAMLHAEVLARLKHPRPILINGKHFEARSTPVHFMMTSNHKAPSIELCRLVPMDRRPPSPPEEAPARDPALGMGRGPVDDVTPSEPNEDRPHVMISLALEDDQKLDLKAWEQWLSAFPALAKYVKVQGVFKSHSTLLLLSMPVHIWDLLPDDQACSFVAFIRSNNLIKEEAAANDPGIAVAQGVRNEQYNAADEEPYSDIAEDLDPELPDDRSLLSGTTFALEGGRRASTIHGDFSSSRRFQEGITQVPAMRTGGPPSSYTTSIGSPSQYDPYRLLPGAEMVHGQQAQQSAASSRSVLAMGRADDNIGRTMILNQARTSRRTFLTGRSDLAPRPALAAHVASRLEEYFQSEPHPSVAVTEFVASNLGVEKADVDLWFYNRLQQQRMNDNLQNLRATERGQGGGQDVRMVLPGHLSSLLDIIPHDQIVLVDLRSQNDFERSHIHGAVSLRAPRWFVRDNFEFIDQILKDGTSRSAFARWKTAKCVIFYDRVLEYSWECPIAEELAGKFRQKGWHGQCYSLKGHYREFSVSYDKYIVGAKMTQDARDYVANLEPSTQENTGRILQEYEEWMERLEHESQTPSADMIPSKMDERKEAVQQHERNMEAEFEERFPALVKKVQGLQPGPSPSSFESPPSRFKGEPRADLAEPLANALDKMHEGSHPRPATSHRSGGGQGFRTPNYDKLGEVQNEDFDEIDPKDAQFRDDPNFQKAGTSSTDTASDQKKTARPGQFWKRLRTTSNK